MHRCKLWNTTSRLKLICSDTADGVDGGDGSDGSANTGGAGGDGGAGGLGGGGGVAFAKSKDNDDVGLVIGTGTELKLSDRFSIGTEGLLYLFDEDRVDFFANGNRIGSLKTDNDFYVVRARLTYHFQ